jgi:hypothetical protein
MKQFTLVLLIFLTSCGKNAGDIISGGGDPPKEGITSSIVGKFAGLAYDSVTFAGVVSSSGTFKCKRGDQVDFYLTTDSRKNDIHIGSTPCTEVISPIELVTWGIFKVNSNIEAMGFSGIGKDYKTGLVRWLKIIYLLDSDNNENNGISFTLARNNLFAQNVSNNPFHPDQIFGNYTTSNVVATNDFNNFINQVEAFYFKYALSENEVLNLLDDMRFGCSTYSCSRFNLP